PKLEIRNKPESRNPNDRNRQARCFGFGHSDFGFVSDFGFRISDLLLSGGNFHASIVLPTKFHTIRSKNNSGLVNHGNRASARRLTIRRTMRLTTFSTGQMRNGGGGGSGQGLPSGPSTLARSGVSTNPGATTPTCTPSRFTSSRSAS